MSGTLLVSLDLELFWGMQDCCPLSEYRENILGGRAAVPRLLALFEKHNVHATWAAVGFLFAGTRQEAERYFPPEELRPTYRKEALSAYRCFAELGEDEEREPCYFGESLLAKIAAVPGQEIASHTFSHYYCREPGQTVAQFEADLTAAKRIAADKGYALTSAVLPRNQCEPEYTAVLRRLGFTAYRDEENDWIHEKVKPKLLMRALRLLDVYFPLTGQGGYTPRCENGIWNLTGSRMYKPRFAPLAFLERVKLHRIKRQMLHAAKNGLTFHLWWHPHNVGADTDYHLKQLEEIFSRYDELREKYGMRSMNMREAAETFSENME